MVGIGQFLQLMAAVHQGVVIDLSGTGLEEVKDNLSVLRVVFVPRIVKSFTGACHRY